MRRYAEIDCGIWDDVDFCALSAGAQRTYFMLISQRDIGASGLLALTLRRWSKYCADLDLRGWLLELVREAYVLIDDATEELLVRTFIRHDGGYKHSKRVLAVIASARGIRSVPLRECALAELARLGIRFPPDTDPSASRLPIDTQSVATRQAIDSRRVVVKEGEYRPEPETRNLGREPAETATDLPPRFCSRHPHGTDAPCPGCARARAACETAERAARDLARRARENCPDCKGGIWLDDGSKCDHPNSRPQLRAVPPPGKTEATS